MLGCEILDLWRAGPSPSPPRGVREDVLECRKQRGFELGELVLELLQQLAFEALGPQRVFRGAAPEPSYVSRP
jgi:hypothetical protein